MKDGIKKVTGYVVEEGVSTGIETVQSGISGFINGFLLKIAVTVTFIVIITAGGCIGASVILDSVTNLSSN